jgi:large subunit ribosomal protein L30
MATLQVTWKRSTIGRPKDQRATIRGLGLKRLNHTVELEDTPSIRGMVKKVIHLIEVIETE